MLGIRRNKKGQKGFALIYTTVMSAFLLIPMAGLAIDFGMLYNIKARLQTACDAAAIGAGYMLHASTNINDPTQKATILSAAQRYFNANYPTGYFGSSLTYAPATIASSTAGKTITVTETATVPMLFMRVLGIAHSQVGAMAISNIKYIAMMIVVDRSGSIVAEGAQGNIQSALTTFVATASTSYLVDSVDTVGMVSFGATWKMDFPYSTTFQSGTPNIGTAITDIDFNSNNSTNTAEGLYQAWAQLYKMNLPGSLNVILLLTDGRPSAFTGNFATVSGCNGGNGVKGNLQSYVGLGWPPPTSGSTDVIGLLATQLSGSYPSWGSEPTTLATPNTGCAFASNTANVDSDLPSGNFPNSVGPVDNVGASWVPSYTTVGTGISTQKGYPTTNAGYYDSPGNSANDPRSVRYASFNVADNMATMIRKDTTLSPMLFVIGIYYTVGGTEALDPDWLARVANDPSYVTVGTDTTVVAAGQSVYQTGQTPGMFCLSGSSVSSLDSCFEQVTNQLLRLIK